MTVRIIFVRFCNECPNQKYGVNGRPQCSKYPNSLGEFTNLPLPLDFEFGDRINIPNWCKLTLFSEDVL
jgi:hypothetical protein